VAVVLAAAVVEIAAATGAAETEVVAAAAVVATEAEIAVAVVLAAVEIAVVTEAVDANSSKFIIRGGDKLQALPRQTAHSI
jgi:hypothetical protein